MNTSNGRLPLALYALTAGAFGIGTTEFVIMGLLMQVSADLGVTISAAGLLVSGYALGVFIGAPLLTAATTRWPRKTVLVALMIVFTLGNLACAELRKNHGMMISATANPTSGFQRRRTGSSSRRARLNGSSTAAAMLVRASTSICGLSSPTAILVRA